MLAKGQRAESFHEMLTMLQRESKRQTLANSRVFVGLIGKVATTLLVHTKILHLARKFTWVPPLFFIICVGDMRPSRIWSGIISR